MRPRVIVESPLSSKTEQGMLDNLHYLQRALRHSWDLGENPFASHAFYPFFLKEGSPEERKAGIEASFQMWEGAKKIIFYTDFGMSPGMIDAEAHAGLLNFEREYRTIGVS